MFPLKCLRKQIKKMVNNTSLYMITYQRKDKINILAMAFPGAAQILFFNVQKLIKGF